MIAFQLQPYWPFLVLVVMFSILTWVRGQGKGGRFGEAIRNSDWHSWKSAVDDKRRELNDLIAAEPKR